MLNTSSGQGATVGGGSINTSSGVRAAVGGGIGNISSGSYGTVPGGYFNSASGLFRFAAGRSANAIHDGSFVWADSQNNYFASTAINQLSVRAAGGVRLSDDTPSISFGAQTRQMLNLWGTSYGIGVQADTLYFRCDANAGNAFAGFRWYRGALIMTAMATPGAAPS